LFADSSSRRGEHLAAVLCVACGLVALAYALFRYRDFVHDDTYITLRHARHWLEGYGPVWNPGERVEGYTSFLMLALVTALGAAGLDLLVAARVVNGCALAALLLYLGWFLRRRAPDQTTRLAAALAWTCVAGSFPLAIWVWSGMEGPLFACLLTAGLGTTLDLLERGVGVRRALAAGALLGLAVLTRPDGALFLGLAGLALASTLSTRGRAALPTLAGFALAAGAIVLPHLLFRLLFYGAWLPNSVVAKTTGLPAGLAGPGLAYVARFLALPPFVAVLAFAAFALAARRTPRDPGLWLLATATLGYLASIASVGGDYLPAARFLAPLLPLFAMLLFRGLAVALPALPPRAGWAAAGVALVLLALQPAVLPKAEVYDPAAVVGTRVGRHIAGRWPPGTRVALHTAGSTPYYAPDYVYVDMLGLNDAHIARRTVDVVHTPWQLVPGHMKGDGRYVLGRDPDVIIAGPAEGALVENGWFLSDFELAALPEFRARYRPRVESIGAMAFTYYERASRSPGG
jgi:hypothetical protein